MKKKLLSLLLCLAMVISVIGIAAPKSAEAASVKLSKKKVTIYAGDTYELQLKNASGDITWKSSKKAVATVKAGTVTALKAGKTTITAKYKGKSYKCKVTVKKAPECESSFSAVANMKIGWNLGNYLDSTGSWLKDSSLEEMITNWGNPIVDESLFKRLKEMGFGAVRVPVTWVYHFDEEGNIDPAWMAKVKEVVDWVLANDMYCIINVHHDTGADEPNMDRWLFASKDNFNKNSEIYSKLWAHIAGEFANYPQELIFEGFNEMLDEESHWADGVSEEALQVINEYNQLFVNTVRKSGGRNATRNLICTTYAAGNFEEALYHYAAPSDTVKDHIIGQVHFYEPFEFTMGGTQKKISNEDLEIVGGIIGMVAEAFETRGDNRSKIPVIIGEFGADYNKNDAERIKWFTTVIKEAKDHGMTCFIWDNGANGNGGNDDFGLLERTGTKVSHPDLIKACIEAAQ